MRRSSAERQSHSTTVADAERRAGESIFRPRWLPFDATQATTIHQLTDDSEAAVSTTTEYGGADGRWLLVYQHHAPITGDVRFPHAVDSTTLHSSSGGQEFASADGGPRSRPATITASRVRNETVQGVAWQRPDGRVMAIQGSKLSHEELIKIAESIL